MNANDRTRVHVLDGARASGTDWRVDQLERRAAALIAWLALEGPTPRARLVGLLYPNVPEATGRNNLVHLLRRIKKLLRGDGAVGERVLDVAPDLWIDARDLWDEPDPADGEVHPDRAAFWRGGEFLEGLDFGDCPELEEWIYAVRERFGARRAREVHARAALLEDAGRLDDALVLATALHDLDPLSEEAARRLMRLHHLAGDRTAALRVYARLREALSRDLGAEPLPETAALARDIERGELPGETVGAAAPRIPVTVLRPPVLVGRAREWAELEDAWAAGQAALVTGEAGLGKSRLLQDFARSRTGDDAPFAFEFRPGDDRVPYGSNVRLFRALLRRVPDLDLAPWVRREIARLLPELEEGGEAPPPIENEGQRARFFLAGVEFVRAAAALGPRVLVFDDLHYIDAGSAEMQRFMWDELGGGDDAPVRFLFGARPEAAGGPGDLMDLVAAGRVRHVPLAPLSAEAVRELVETVNVPNLGGHAELLERAVGGHPQFLLETVKHLIETGARGGALPEGFRPPAGVSAVIRRRLERLSPAALHVARAAAVLERDFTVEHVAGVLGVPFLDVATSWEELEGAQVLAGDRFAHDLVFETVRAALPSAVGAMLHRRAAQTLGADGAEPARVAHHWSAGGDSRAAGEWLVRAAEAASRAYRLREAVAFSSRAAEAFENAGRPEEAFDALWLTSRHMQALTLQADLPALSERLLRLARTPLQHARAREARLIPLMEAGRIDDLEATAREGLEWARQADEKHLQAAFWDGLIGVAIMRRRLDDARLGLEEYGRLGEALGDLSIQATAEEGLGALLNQTRRREAATHLERAVRLNAGAGDLFGQASGLHKHAHGLYELGEGRASTDLGARAHALMANVEGGHNIRLINAHERFLAHFSLHEYDAALRLVLNAMRAEAEEGAGWMGMLSHDLALLFVALGQPAQAEIELRAAETHDNLPANQRHRVRLARAVLLAATGRDAQEAFDAAEAEPAYREHPFDRGSLLVCRAPTLAPAAALAAADEALALAATDDLRGLRRAALVRRADAARRLGDLDAALRDSATALAEPGDTFLVSPGDAWLARERALRAAEDATGADEAARALRAWVRDTAERQVPPEYRAAFEALYLPHVPAGGD